MRPIPVSFHIWHAEIHTYGIGLAITFWFGYRYFARRLRQNGFPDEWLAGTFVAVVVSSIVGARIVHVLANLSLYRNDPASVFSIWQGGLSSYGGLALAIPVGFTSARRRCPSLKASVASELVAPVLVSAWAIGRLLGPQLMVAGGGKATNAWYGMYYAGQIGRRIPVPLFQAAECGAIFLTALWLERLVRSGRLPIGVVTASVFGLWGLSRFFDEYFWLTNDSGTDAIEIGSMAMFVVGAAFAVWLIVRSRRGSEPSPDPGAPADGGVLEDSLNRWAISAEMHGDSPASAVSRTRLLAQET
ncbi:MAG TPA: prolipoprotein diacylglyceryl transferase family protein [Acidimicrobiales bacterium]|jgi:phosphatidylglycerol:prolipoprotein diacylglycerol transferase|nr:prolipoprotein diacylglyceryl transferase family protein [Acidimicrobiales bacterium]